MVGDDPMEGMSSSARPSAPASGNASSFMDDATTTTSNNNVDVSKRKLVRTQMVGSIVRARERMEYDVGRVLLSQDFYGLTPFRLCGSQ
jgi:hypothetical protein